MIIHFSINDLAEINIAAKSFKQKDFMLINHNNKPFLISLDRYKIFISISEINPENMVLLPPDVGLIFNYAELGNFIKNLSIEKDITVDTDLPRSLAVSFMGNAGMYVKTDKRINLEILNILNRIDNMNNTISFYSLEEDVTDRLDMLYTHHKADGGVYFIYKDRYYITLSYGVLPLNKTNKIYLSVIDNPNEPVFSTRFRVDKKKTNVYVYATYRKL